MSASCVSLLLTAKGNADEAQSWGLVCIKVAEQQEMVAGWGWSSPFLLNTGLGRGLVEEDWLGSCFALELVQDPQTLGWTQHQPSEVIIAS